MRRLAAKRATGSVHVLVVEVPGHWITRVHVEAEIRGRGWHRAVSPADADALVVCGAPSGDLAAAVDRVWDQLPGPRVRTLVAAPRDATAALDRLCVDLLDLDALQEDARSRPTDPETQRETDHGGMDHGGMDHGGMDMSPGGIPLAEGAPDRDGLEMDELHLPLGPVLPHWPAGLVLRCALHGDVVASAVAELAGAGAGHEHGDRQPRRVATAPELEAAVRLDNVASVLALAGWDDPATRAERLRDALVTGRPAAEVAPAVSALRRTVGRGRLLRWSLRGIRPISDHERAVEDWPGWWVGDVHDRLLSLLDRAASALGAQEQQDRTAGRAAATSRTDAPDLLRALPKLVTGLDLATARLVVAGLGLDPVVEPEVAHA